MRKNGFSYKGNKPRFVWETLPIYPNDHEKFRRIEKAKNYKEKPRGNLKTNSKYTEESVVILIRLTFTQTSV